MTLDWLGPIWHWEPSCVVPDDPIDTGIVRHAMRPDARALEMLREQALARLTYDPDAVQQREQRIAQRVNRR